MINNTQRIKILVELMHGIGDTVCAIPMLKVLRDNYPEAEIVVLTKSDAGKDIIAASHINIDKVYVFDIYKNLGHSINFLLKLRKYRFDYGISSCITPVKKAKMFMEFINPKKWIGLQKKGLFFDLLEDKYHFVEANLLSIQAICKIPSEKIYPTIFVQNDVKDKIQKMIFTYLPDEYKSKKIVGICIGSGDYSLKNRYLRIGKVYPKGWGIGNIVELIRYLKNRNLVVCLLGGKLEETLLNFIQAEVPIEGNLVNFVGKTTMKESIALTALCECVIGVDTGMQHVAAAVGTPTISIFGPTNPKRCGGYAENAQFVECECSCKYCYGTNPYIECKERICLQQIKVQTVVNYINSVLEGKM